MLDGLDTYGRRDMAFSGAGPTDQHHVLGVFHELATMQLADGGLVDIAGGKVVAREIFVGREARNLHVVCDGSHFPFRHFRLQQL